MRSWAASPLSQVSFAVPPTRRSDLRAVAEPGTKPFGRRDSRPPRGQAADDAHCALNPIREPHRAPPQVATIQLLRHIGNHPFASSPRTSAWRPGSGHLPQRYRVVPSIAAPARVVRSGEKTTTPAPRVTLLTVPRPTGWPGSERSHGSQRVYPNTVDRVLRPRRTRGSAASTRLRSDRANCRRRRQRRNERAVRGPEPNGSPADGSAMRPAGR